MLGTIPGQMSQSLKVPSRTVRTVQMCSQAEDTANNSLQLECARQIVTCVNCLPPLVEVLGDNVPFILDGAGGTDISGVVRPQITQPAMTPDYFMWSQNRRQDTAAKSTGGHKCPSDIPQGQNPTQSLNKAKK